LFLPGQNIHGGTLTLFTLLFGLSVPPLCLAAGLVLGFMSRHRCGNRGLWWNASALALYVFWATGGLDKVLG
jgi:hypothetical protein